MQWVLDLLQLIIIINSSQKEGDFLCRLSLRSGRRRLLCHLLHKYLGDRHVIGVVQLWSRVDGHSSLVLIAWRRLDVAARSTTHGGASWRLHGSVQVRRERRRRTAFCWCRRLDAIQVDAGWLVVTAEAVSVDLVDHVCDTRAAVQREEDWNNHEQRDVHAGFIVVAYQRFGCRETCLCRFCTAHIAWPV